MIRKIFFLMQINQLLENNFNWNKKKKKKILDLDVTRKRNLPIWSRTRYQLRHEVLY